MTHIDDKIPISGDAAETIAAYLDELNNKLAHIGVENTYSIVAETETLILGSIKELNKQGKTTLEEVMQILNKQGTPDEVVSRYIELHNLKYPETSPSLYDIEPSTKSLPKREGDLLSGVGQIIKRTLLISPIASIIIALLFISEPELSFGYLILSALLFGSQELFTGLTGKLLEEYSTTLLFRKIYRGLLFMGTFLIFSIISVSQYFDVDYYNYYYGEELFIFSLLIFLSIEFLVLIRDHTNGFHPIEPEFRPFIRFLTLPYILLIISLLLMIFQLGFFPQELKIFLFLLFAVLASVSTSIKKYKVSIRFYLTALSIVLVPKILSQYEGHEFNQIYFTGFFYDIFMIIQLLAITFSLIMRNLNFLKSELQNYFSKLNDYYQSY